VGPGPPRKKQGTEMRVEWKGSDRKEGRRREGGKETFASFYMELWLCSWMPRCMSGWLHTEVLVYRSHSKIISVLL